MLSFGPCFRQKSTWLWLFGCNFQSGSLQPLIVQISASISCPFCGQTFELVIDTGIASQRFTTDCEVCCRPVEIFVEAEPGEILSLDVQSG
jgi:hypothetical protein